MPGTNFINGVPYSVDGQPGAQVVQDYQALVTKAINAIDTNIAFVANGAPTNADVVAQVKILSRECTGVIRMLLSQLNSTAGT